MCAIVYDARKLKAYDRLESFCESCGKSEEYISKLWDGLISDDKLLNELYYYLDNQQLLDEYKFAGYSLTDMYVWQISRYNLMIDIGKNPIECNKDIMVIESFMSMILLKEDPEGYKRKMDEGRGMDQYPG